MCANPSVFIEVCNPFSSESHRKACAFFVLHGRSQTQMKLVTWMSNRNEGPICARIAAAQPLPSATRSSEDWVGCARTVCLSDGPHQPQLCLFSSRWVVSGLLDQYRGPPSLAWRKLCSCSTPCREVNAMLPSSHRRTFWMLLFRGVRSIPLSIPLSTFAHPGGTRRPHAVLTQCRRFAIFIRQDHRRVPAAETPRKASDRHSYLRAFNHR